MATVMLSIGGLIREQMVAAINWLKHQTKPNQTNLSRIQNPQEKLDPQTDNKDRKRVK